MLVINEKRYVQSIQEMVAEARDTFDRMSHADATAGLKNRYMGKLEGQLDMLQIILDSLDADELVEFKEILPTFLDGLDEECECTVVDNSVDTVDNEPEYPSITMSNIDEMTFTGKHDSKGRPLVKNDDGTIFVLVG